MLEPMPDDGGTVLMGSLADVDLAAAGYVQSEWRCSGTAEAYRAGGPLGADGRWDLEVADRAAFATRAVVRLPADPGRASGTVVVEWLNVSSGADAAPVFGFAGPEVVRAGHAWVGVSAQWAGVVSAPALVDVGGVALQALQDADPDRYGDLHHPGDAFCFDIFTRVAAAVVGEGGPLDRRRVDRVLAVGESQSAYALTTYVDGVLPLTDAFDGVLVHSRGGPPMPLGHRDRGVDLEAGRDDPAVRIRDDLDVPVLVLQTETDVLGHLYSLPARQPDTDRLRLWEVAGSAHADRSLIGDLEGLLGCADPVNRGQQRFVVRSALRHLDSWAGGGPAPPVAERLVVEGDPSGGRRGLSFATDDRGIVRGGVRTPCVDAPVEVLSGLGAPGASHVCLLFGRTLPVPTDELRARYPSPAAYLDAYAQALDAAIEAGFVLPEDRDEVLADARTGLVTW
ncbi:alpha/beta hydrolase domain-containing protein [Iamia majanohamensis]|uniref:Alpha/beta hydrolase domain-containing protein n=1 Tax=Iamia majanohamensis TaxID=467976 RepID=A0AAE9YBH4_9ACTN|nr:alpha/beta hydrolase domain-containing protein [Iamia majanohamensis]WCO68058.1 alpha/beta hydrolase domain-containing protein [Iamia majanohamensis]